MNKDYLIKLTQNLYRLTLLFPKKEPFRYKMREVADDILAHSINNQHPRLVKDLEILDSFFEVAKAQNWVPMVELLSLQEEYNKIKAEIKKIDKHPQKNVEVQAGQIISWRQEKILEFLKENGRAQVWQLKQILPEVTKRTLRRDFERLLKQGVIERIGERNNTFYQLKR